MWARELKPRPRCPTLCYDTDNNDEIVQCAMWEGHDPPDEHQTYRDVIGLMTHSLLYVRGVQNEATNVLAGWVMYRAAVDWYGRLVIE